MKAKLKGDISLLEFCKDDMTEEYQWGDRAVEYDLDRHKCFGKGEIVEVVKEVIPEDGRLQYIIYSKRINESTVVGEHLLEIMVDR